MNRKDITISYGADGKEVEQVSVKFPNCRTSELVLTLHIEAIVLGDSPEFMVSSNQENLTGILQFQQAQQRNCFHTMGSSVDVISKEEVICVWQFSSDFENLQDIEKLTMYISNNCDWQGDSFDIFLLYEDVLQLKAQDLNRLLIEDLASQCLLQKTIDIEAH